MRLDGFLIILFKIYKRYVACLNIKIMLLYSDVKLYLYDLLYLIFYFRIFR